MNRAVSLPRASAAGAASSSTAPAASRVQASAPSWLVWTNLWIVYIVWGSTYLAIRIMVETVPALLGAGLRFALAGVLMLTFLVVRRGWTAVRPTRRQLLGCLAVGLLLPGANGVVTVAEKDVPSGLAALLIAAVPLIVILLRRATGDPISPRSAVGVIVGFVGVAILLLPGERPDGASLVGMLAIVGAAAMWATGSFASPRLDLPADPFVSTGWNMLLGGGAIAVVGLIAGEAGEVDFGAFTTDSMLAWAYLVVVGSLFAFSAYVWLLQNAPVSKVSTYAYVNPVIAIFLGWIVLSETITTVTLVGAAIIVASVATVVRAESPGPEKAASKG